MTTWAVVAGYLAIGVIVALVGPGRRELARQVAGARGTSVSRAVLGRPSVPEWKLLVFQVLLTIVMVLVWPLPLWSALQEKREFDAWEREHAARLAQGLEFSRMGGAGVISCQDCGFRQEISSFMHGITSGPNASADEGRQCLQCGKFVTAHLKGNPPVTAIERCECGGELSRDHFLFCPKCRSRKLEYRMTVIT
jgi:hypothetical protein